jgi:hypothetical protein
VLLDSDDFNYKNIIFENLRQGTPEYEKSIFPAFYDCYYFSDPIFYKK